MPGTVGTFATIPFLYILALANITNTLIIAVFFLIFILTSITANIAQKEFNQDDPQWIVIDESLGIWFAWFFRVDNSFTQLLLLAVIFRFFDIIKVWPASFFDKKIKNGLGIVMDDIVAGAYTGLTYIIFFRFYNSLA